MRLSIDELRDIVGHLKKGAESLYRYGDVGRAKTLFGRLSEDDQKRLLFLAFAENDKDIADVATALMHQLTPPCGDIEELLGRMDASDRAEIERLQLELACGKSELSDVDRQRIMDVLSESCKRTGSLAYEEACWVLIPLNREENITWLPAGTYSLPDEVQYVPDRDELHRLLDAMRSSLWVIHIHNHPHSAKTPVYYGASEADKCLAKYWKHLRPEIGARMKFFIIHKNTAFEYTENTDHADQWLGEKIQNIPLSEKEYYEEHFPFDVARKMAKEARDKAIDEILGEA